MKTWSKQVQSFILNMVYIGIVLEYGESTISKGVNKEVKNDCVVALENEEGMDPKDVRYSVSVQKRNL